MHSTNLSYLSRMTHQKALLWCLEYCQNKMRQCLFKLYWFMRSISRKSSCFAEYFSYLHFADLICEWKAPKDMTTPELQAACEIMHACQTQAVKLFEAAKFSSVPANSAWESLLASGHLQEVLKQGDVHESWLFFLSCHVSKPRVTPSPAALPILLHT